MLWAHLRLLSKADDGIPVEILLFENYMLAFLWERNWFKYC